MSVAEIKEQIRQMTSDERREVVHLIAELEGVEGRAPRQAATFAEAKTYVFQNYQDLLRRLAQ